VLTLGALVSSDNSRVLTAPPGSAAPHHAPGWQTAGVYPYAPSDPWRDNRRFVRVAGAVWLSGIAIAGVAIVGSGSGGTTPALGSGAGVFGVVALAGQVMVIVATWRLARAHASLGRPGSTWGPGWAVAGRIIPVANAIIPALQLDELWRGSHPDAPRGDPTWRTRAHSRLARLLLAAGLVSTALGVIATVRMFTAFVDAFGGVGDSVGFNDAIDDAIADSRPWRIAAILASAVVATLTAVLLARVADRQQQLHETEPPPAAIVPAPPHRWQATFPPGWFADPWGRFPLRWWDGTVWTTHVSIDGRTAHDPLPATPSSPTG